MTRPEEESLELPAGVYIEDPGYISHLESEGMSRAEAESFAYWMWASHQLADEISQRFDDTVVNTELDGENRTLIIYATGDTDELEAFVAGLELGSVHVDVRTGFLSNEEVAEQWQRIETALIEAGVDLVGGAVAPNRITVVTGDPDGAAAVIAALAIPEEIVVEFEDTGGPPEPQEAPWILAADQELGPHTTSVEILVEEQACASGKPATGRIVEPDIVYESDRVIVTVRIRPREGLQDCQGNPRTPYVLHLDEPLGSRILVDGLATP